MHNRNVPVQENQAARYMSWFGYYIYLVLIGSLIMQGWVNKGEPLADYFAIAGVFAFSVIHALILVVEGNGNTGFGRVVLVMSWLLCGLAWWSPTVPTFMATMVTLYALILVLIQGSILAPKPMNHAQKSYAHAPINEAQDDALNEQEGFINPALPSEISFRDVVGMDATKVELRAALDAAMNKNDQRNGIMLSGKPGNGKTLLANALAGEAKLPMISVSFGDIASRWVNQTSERVKQVFDDARAQAPCVLFLDEIDSVLGDRGSVANSDSESPKITNLMLTELVNLRGKGVLIVAATNYLDRLDSAAVRAGRFDFKIEIPMPDAPARRAILADTLRATSLKRGSGVMLSSEAVLNRVTRRWEGFSCATLSAIAKSAVDIGYKYQTKTIDFRMWMEALRKVQGDARRLPEGTPTIDELICNEPVREALKSLSTRLIKIEEIEELGGSVPSGVLFYGPPGTGKTLTARALAKSSDWAFLSTSGNALLRDVNVIDELIEKASNLRPCIVFIDEADDALADRGNSPHTTTVTNKLLAAIDGADGKIPDVVFIAATNNPHMMDSAALRGGRFTEKIGFELPDQDTTLKLIQMWQKKSIHDFSHIHVEMAEALNGESPANVMAVLQACMDQIAIRHINGDRSAVNLSDFQSGYARVLG
jgi:transitional endoplasmic reticulum ATPase